MHQTVIDFLEEVKSTYPFAFKGCRVLDVGSIDINGTNKKMFERCNYIGIDLIEGKNVDKVTPCHEMTGEFDTIISTEAFEHDKYLCESLINICRMLRTGGFFIFTCATLGRQEHGTKSKLPQDSATTQIKGWEDYYRNVTRKMVEPYIKDYFRYYEFTTKNTDLQFVGVRNHKEV